jgi:hypothetical protein
MEAWRGAVACDASSSRWGRGREAACRAVGPAEVQRAKYWQSNNDGQILAWRFASTIEANHIIGLLHAGRFNGVT